MNDNLTDVTVLLDRTGSMAAIKDDVIGGFNQFIADQQKVKKGECVFTLVQFDSNEPYEVVCLAVPVKDMKLLTKDTYIPRACTPLLDSLGRTIVKTGERLAAMDDAARPGKVLFVIVTDGQENASYEYNRKQVFDMITIQRDQFKWDFLFLAANQDAIAEGGRIGTMASQSMKYDHTGQGIRAAMVATSAVVANYRNTGDRTALDYSDKDRQDASAGENQ